MNRAKAASLAQNSTAADAKVSAAVARLTRLVAAVKQPGEKDSEFDRALKVLKTLSQKEGIPIAIVGGMAAIEHGYLRNTKDIDLVIARQHLDTIVRVAPQYRIKVIWQDPQGWHELQYEGIDVEVVPEGAKPSKSAPTTIPGPRQLGVTTGLGYANLEGWIETKVGSGRRQDQADVVQVLKKCEPAATERVRQHLGGVHASYLRLFEELVASAAEEMEQEKERGGPR